MKDRLEPSFAIVGLGGGFDWTAKIFNKQSNMGVSLAEN
jgi:hypothetical protein